MRVAIPLANAAAVIVTVTACSSLAGSGKSGIPSCSDTSASASRLAHGCKRGGRVYNKVIATRCVDGRTMYNVPDVPPHGVSGFSDGKLRTHAVSTDEVMHCQTG